MKKILRTAQNSPDTKAIGTLKLYLEKSEIHSSTQEDAFVLLGAN